MANSYDYCGHCSHRKKAHSRKGCKECQQNKQQCPGWVPKTFGSK